MTKDEALKMAIDKWANNFTHERHQNNAETKFWLAQYKMAFNDLFNTCKEVLQQPAQELEAYLRSALDNARDVCKYLDHDMVEKAKTHTQFFWDDLDKIRELDND